MHIVLAKQIEAIGRKACGTKCCATPRCCVKKESELYKRKSNRAPHSSFYSAVLLPEQPRVQARLNPWCSTIRKGFVLYFFFTGVAFATVLLLPAVQQASCAARNAVLRSSYCHQLRRTRHCQLRGTTECLAVGTSANPQHPVCCTASCAASGAANGATSCSASCSASCSLILNNE